MAKPQISFRIVGSDLDDGAVAFEVFVSFCANVTKCLKSVEHVVVGAPGHIRYRISDLQYGSAMLALTPVPGPKGRVRECQQVASLFRQTVEAIGKGVAVDKRFQSDDLRRFRDLAQPLERRAKEVWIGRTRITGKFTENIDKLIEGVFLSQGEVAGQLDRIDVHGRYEFELFPPLGGKVTCEFDPQLLSRVLRAIKRHVHVVGTLHYAKQEPNPQRVRVESFDVRPRNDDLPTLASLRGIAPDCTGGVDSVDFVRAIRDEQD